MKSNPTFASRKILVRYVSSLPGDDGPPGEPGGPMVLMLRGEPEQLSERFGWVPPAEFVGPVQPISWLISRQR